MYAGQSPDMSVAAWQRESAVGRGMSFPPVVEVEAKGVSELSAGVDGVDGMERGR